MPNDVALVIVDLQKDFCPGGALGVPRGDEIIPFLNSYVRLFRKYALPIFVTRDWHPAKTSHFIEYGGPWPPHCIQGSEGARFHPGMELPPDAILLSKGMDPTRDEYSAFSAVSEGGTSLSDIMRQKGISRIYLGGLATDYCVKHTALDALRAGYSVTVLEDAIRGVDLTPEDSARAVADMTDAGAEFTTIEKLSGTLRNR